MGRGRKTPIFTTQIITNYRKYKICILIIMNSLANTFFGPLDKNACVYFLIIAVVFFISLILILIHEIFYIIQNYNKLNFKMLIKSFFALFNTFVGYFINRLLYNMCMKSLV